MTSIKHFLLDHEHRLLGLMLFSLLAAIHLGNTDTIAKSFLIVHFGFFLLWQPIVKQQATFTLKQLVIVVLLTSAYIYFFNPWLNAFWSLLLLTLLTGRIFARGLARAIYGFAVVILFLEIILITTPTLFKLAALTPSLQAIVSTIITFSPLILLFIPTKDTTSRQVDFIRGFLIILLVMFLCMSSVLISLTTKQPYLEALVVSVLILSIFLLFTAFLWAPRAGFSGLAKLLENYLLNIGGPFEQWITQVSTLEANTSISPAHFLSASLKYLMQQDWVSGVSWQTEFEKDIVGHESSHKVVINDEKLSLIIYTKAPVGPSLFLHTKLLLSVLTFYYRAKLQEQQMVKQAHLKAIYETGSKLTHDVKNILQATQTMTQIINDNDSEMEEIVGVIKKQMPLLTQRLNITLEKLRSPENTEDKPETSTGSLLHWWHQLQLRYTDRNLTFSSNIVDDREINLDVFTTVVENLLDNARSKKLREPGIEIFVTLSIKDKQLTLSVTDTGSAIEPAVAEQLFKEVIASNDGFGIGLYQSYEMAKSHGYNLKIEDNSNGKVRFTLS